MTTFPPTKQGLPGFNLAQRAIHGVFGTREFAVVLLIVFCFAVEVGILAATQRYESVTKPIGTELFWGMSAAGMVVFFAEALKLPVAWVSGVVHGRRRWTLNIITFGLCLLTAITIKDLTVYEWDLALAPSRKELDKAAQLKSTIELREQQIADLTTNAGIRLAFLKKELADNNTQRDALQLDRDRVMSEFNESKRALDDSLVDPSAKLRIEALEAQLQQDATEFDRQLRELEASGDTADKDAYAVWSAEVQAVTDRNKTEVEKADQEFADAERDYDLRYQDWEKRVSAYRAECAAIDAKLEEDLKKLDTKFDFLDIQRDKLNKEAEDRKRSLLKDKYGELKEPERPKKRVPNLEQVPVRPPATQTPVVRAKIDELKQAYETTRAGLLAQCDSIRRGASRPPDAEYTKKLKDLEVIRDERMTSLNAQVASLLGAQANLQRQIDIMVDQTKIQAEIEKLEDGLPEMRDQRAASALLSQQLAADTNPVRFSRGILRWLMPNSPPERQLEAAYALFPPLIAILVATLPALLLELGVSSLRPDVVAAEARRPPLLHRLSRRRRALLLLQHRAAMASQRAQSTLEQLELRRTALLAEFEKRQSALSDEVEEAVTARLKTVKVDMEAMQAQVIDAQKREAALATQLAETTTQLRKLSEDNAALAAHVVHLDARRPPAPV
jgi:hypothetical protein